MWEGMYSLKRNIGVEEVWDELKACYRALCIKCLAFSKDGGWLNIKVTGFLSRKSEDQLKAEVMQECGQLKDLGVTSSARCSLPRPSLVGVTSNQLVAREIVRATFINLCF